jgi:adenine-specific DNA-methyltransferase
MNFGQYYTTDNALKEAVFSFIKNSPNIILEPSVGRGDLVQYIHEKMGDVQFDMYEIDQSIVLLAGIQNVTYCDFLKYPIAQTYKTIVGNPPYVRTKKGNLYIDFVRKCYGLLDFNGELIFIVPSDFLKLTSASELLDEMMKQGTITDIYHPHDENLFENASIDVLVFRYCKNHLRPKHVLYNDKLVHLVNSNGLITFDNAPSANRCLLGEHFNVYVGLVSGKEEVYKNDSLGNIEVLTGDKKLEKYIYIQEFPCENALINAHLLQHKKPLITRRIRKFNETNWFEWGALRNIQHMVNEEGNNCIYVYNLTRKPLVAFKDKVQYFGGNLIMLKPKQQKINLDLVIDYLNSAEFKKNFIFAGRFKIGHRQLCNATIPSTLFS